MHKTLSKYLLAILSELSRSCLGAVTYQGAAGNLCEKLYLDYEHVRSTLHGTVQGPPSQPLRQLQLNHFPGHHGALGQRREGFRKVFEEKSNGQIYFGRAVPLCRKEEKTRRTHQMYVLVFSKLS